MGRDSTPFFGPEPIFRSCCSVVLSQYEEPCYQQKLLAAMRQEVR